MSAQAGSVEVLDATDPVATQRVCRLMRGGSLGMSNAAFWYFSAELAIVVAAFSLAVLPWPWWVTVSWAVPAGCVLNMAVLSIKVRLRVGIRPGDQWYVLESSEHRAVALVKTRQGRRFVAGSAADSSELSRQVRRFFDDRTLDRNYFLTAGLERTD